MKRVVAAAGALLACALPLVAPARLPQTEAGHLRIGVLRDVDSINPLLSTQAASTDLAQLIFSGLIRYDDRGDPIPDAAEAVPTRANGGISADGKTITYHLRRNVVFSDGAPLTARDVVFTWHAILNPANNVPQHFPYDLAQSVVARDPRTVVVRLREPNAAFVALFMRCGTQGAILPEHLLGAKHDLNQNPYNRQPIGSGPFVVTSYQPGSAIELARNPRWWGPHQPALQRISYRFIPNENSLLIALRTHEIDFYYEAPEQQFRELRGIPGVHVSAKPFMSYEQVAFNTRRAPFDDVRVRQAAAYAIDWRALERSVYLSVDLPGVTDVFPLSWAYEPSVKHYPRDLTKSRALLDAAGWHVGGDGIRTRNGGRLSVLMRTVAGVIPRQNAEVMIQQELRDVGFDVQILNAPANLLFAPQGAGGLLAKGDFDAAIYGWTEVPDPADDLQTLGPDRVPPYGVNFTGLRDPEIGRLQREGTRVYERERRKPAYRALQRREHELVPFETIVWRANIDAVSDDFQGFRPAVGVSDFWNPWDWSI
ncbi:MAG TPA: peptide ABC transporter substrate-binding protein [Candidatus Acidoferrum sp.]|nr:peptide ABC transporter substrate-binding protein [Candidatus Acidoferrum sp.]